MDMEIELDIKPPQGGFKIVKVSTLDEEAR